MMNAPEHTPQAGDHIEIRGLPGAPTRSGIVTEVLGAGSHRHYRVRWDEQHESLFFPASGEGVHVSAPRGRRTRAR